MTIELLQNLSLVSYILAGILFVLAVALFFFLDIKKAIGNVTGATARKAIQNIRRQNEVSRNRAYKSRPVNQSREMLTDKISRSGKLKPRAYTYGRTIRTEELANTAAVPVPDETAVPAEAEQTPCESEAPDTVFAAENDFFGQTNEEFLIDVELGFIGSSEIIE